MRNDLTSKYRPMDNSVQDYEFLDLDGLGEDDLSHLRSVLGANPEHQGLSLPWSEDDESSLEPPSKPDCNNEPRDWLASPDPAAAQLQFAVATLPPPPHAFLPPPFFSGGSPTCQWLQPLPAGEPINGAGHLDLDVEVTSGDEGSQPVLQEALQDGIVSAPPDMASVVASSASQPLASHPDSALMHGQAYTQTQQPEEQHAMYSTFVPPNAIYPPHAMAYPHPPVTTFQMIDASPQPPPPRDQTRGRARKSMNKRDMMHHNQDMMPRGHVPHYDYGQYTYPPYAYPYAQMPPVHQAAGSPIYMFATPMYHEYHQPMGMQGVPPGVPQGVPPGVAPGVPQGVVPQSVPQNIPRSVPQSMPQVGPPGVPGVVPQSAPPKVPFPPAPTVTMAAAAPIPAQAGPTLLPPPPVIPVPVVTVPPPVATVAAPLPVVEPLPATLRAEPPAAPSGPTVQAVKEEVQSPPRASGPAATPTLGPPAGAVLSGRRPDRADVKKEPNSASAPGEEIHQASDGSSPSTPPKQQPQHQPTHSPVNSQPSAVASSPVPAIVSTSVSASSQATTATTLPNPVPATSTTAPSVNPTETTTATPVSLAAAPVAPPVSSQPVRQVSPEPASVAPPATTPSVTSASNLKAEESRPSTSPQSSGAPWGKPSFASLFSSKKSSSPAPPVPSGYSSSSNSVPNSHSQVTQRSDGPQAVSPPTQSGWGPMQPPHKGSHNFVQTPNHPPASAVPSGIAPALPAPIAAHDPKLYRLSEFLHEYKLDHKPASLQPRGLTNRNNWCYINATLQALLACPPFYNLFTNMPDTPSGRSSSESHTAIIESMKMFVSEFNPLPASARLKRADRAARSKEGEVQYDIPTGPPFEPQCVYRMLSVIQTDTMVEGRQEDAEEFLSCLLNGLNDEMLDLMKMTRSNELVNGDVTSMTSASPPSNGETELNQEEADEWKVMGPKNKGAVTISTKEDFSSTPLSDIFRGYLRSRVVRSGQAHESNNISESVQPFFTLQLDIENTKSVKEALEAYVRRDKVEGLTCSRSNQEVPAWQEVQLEELPPVLLLHLKWFDYSQDGCSKKLKTIHYDIDLKVESKVLASRKQKAANQQQYKLFAVVYHDGKEATKGHYITDAFHVGYNSWIRYDDSTVKVMSQSQVLQPRAPRVPYLLYYRRLDTMERH